MGLYIHELMTIDGIMLVDLLSALADMLPFMYDRMLMETHIKTI